ncbi:unnamed protein product [Phaedon cochleariae]|uniref:Reverse transcriptase domain-containing protein n=1 Tax=Phaedon cochleariae TaxID=80249 RepID=A0A9N9SB09_PHACE|nr:unnamed protein product [Phaedon cochleariae]
MSIDFPPSLCETKQNLLIHKNKLKFGAYGFLLVYIFYTHFDMFSNPQCIIEMPNKMSEIFREPEFCNFCENITKIDKVENISPDTFYKEYVKTAKPVVVTDGIKNWPASTTFSFQFFKNLYSTVEKNGNPKKSCQFFPYKTEFKGLEEVFGMSQARASLSPGEKPWYVGWSNCNNEAGKKLRKYYSKPYFLGNNSENIAMTWIFMGGPGYGAHMHITFRQRTIRKISLGLKTIKACGSDGIPPIDLKKCAPELTPVLCKLFYYSYELGIFPSNCKIARIMETAINIELMKYLEHSGIINDRQYGFRHQISTSDLLAYVSHIWQQSIEKYGETLAVALDISKAFDRVWHHGLLAKLPSSLHVVVDGVSSDSLTINAGVPQESILAPTLFLLHINDLLKATSCPVHSFADDSTLHTAFSSRAPIQARQIRNERGRNVDNINMDLATILERGSINLVDFNANKT